MYELKPPYVIQLEEVANDPLMSARANRVLGALTNNPPVHTASIDDLPELFQELQFGTKGGRAGNYPFEHDPPFFFGKMRWDGRWQERFEKIQQQWPKAPAGVFRAALGYDLFSWFTSGQGEIKICEDHVCRPAWRIHLVQGCPHRCFYCGLMHRLTMMMNVEEYLTKLAELSAKNPWQKTWLYEDDSEALAQEPEYGGLPAIMEFCAQSEDNYVIIHTKSANVDWMKDFPHNGRTILVWSLTGPTQSKVLEPLSATMSERIEAARKCHEWGYTTRFKYKPIVPLRGWRDELSEMTRQVFEKTHPDVISLFTLAWMDYSEVIKHLDPDLLDPEAREAAAAAEEELGKIKVRPFPHHIRKSIYEHCIKEIRSYSQDIPISLCTESTQMWKELGPVLGLEPGNYPCGCGPTATPWLKQLPDSPWSIAKPVWVDGALPPVKR